MNNDEDFFQQLTYFQVIPDFDAQSRNGSTCSISNLNKQRPELGREDHEVDEFILRGPLTDFEGFIDIRPTVLLKTASELGMVSQRLYAQVEQENNDLYDAMRDAEARAAAYQQELDSMRAAIRNSFLDGESRPSEDVLDTDYLPLPEED